MKYETPELTVLAPAANAIQATSGTGLKVGQLKFDSVGPTKNEIQHGYADWE